MFVLFAIFKTSNFRPKIPIMSFKLFVASTFGLIKSTAKLEAAHEALLTDYQMFCEFEKSAELKEYYELDLLVKSDTFLQMKREIQQLTFKGSKEEAQLSELKKLERNGRLQKFYATLKSENFKRFNEIEASEELATYKKLKAIVKSSLFDVKKKQDEKSEEFIQASEYHKIKNSDEILFYERFAKSSEYKNFLLMNDSPERKRHEELQKITKSEKFKEKVAYLEDTRKWNKTEEYLKEVRLGELKKLPQLINYLKYKHSNALDFFKKWQLVFEDRFESKKLDTQKWMTLSHLANQTLGRNFSQVGDLHAFTDGDNVLLDGKSLKLEVRKEKAKSMQWRIPLGFVEQKFDYTSGIVSTAGTDWWKYGIIETKVKYEPVKHLVDIIYLLGEESSPQIKLVEMGVKNRLGLFSKTAEGSRAECESISGLKTGEFYIFRLEWTPNSLIWKINNREIFRIDHNVPTFKMHLNAASIVVADPTDNLPHQFEIDWVRFYQHRKE
jgi:hypothetical protein